MSEQTKHEKAVECEQCGCRDTRLVDRYLGELTYQCNHCAHRTIAGLNPYEEVSTEYRTTICPHCESTRNKVTRGPQEDRSGRFKRFHLCGDCRLPFASYEQRDKKKNH